MPMPKEMAQTNEEARAGFCQVDLGSNPNLLFDFGQTTPPY